MDLSGADWVKLNELLDEALDIEPSRRSQWLDSLGPEHRFLSETLRDVLLRQQGPETAEVLRQPPPIGAKFASVSSGDIIGPYKVIRELGAGGTATVWLAERIDASLKRQVALKLPRIAWMDRGLADRLDRERDILATLDHPSIARIYDAGMDTTGRPYLALEYVEGVSLDRYVTDNSPSLGRKIDLFLLIARAIAFAHAHLIVHRDLKPSNVMVKDNGEIRLLDFGIARLLESQPLPDSQLTRAGARALTPHYAAPEQFTNQPITVATDVYSLGVLLYWLLAGRSPYGLELDTLAAFEDAIVNRDPAPLIEGMTRAAARPLRGDLAAIVSKAMRKRPQDRYETVNAFIDDIERHLHHLPIRAQALGWSYRCRKFIARNKTRVAAGSVTFVALVAAFAIAVWQARAAQAEAQRAERIKSFIASIFTQAVPKQGVGGAVTASELLTAATKRVDAELGEHRGDMSELQVMIASSFLMLEEPEKAVSVLRSALRNCDRRSEEFERCSLHAAVKLAGALKLTGKYAEALQILEGQLPQTLPAAPDMAEDFVVGLRVRAELLGYLNRLEESEVALLRAIKTSERVLGPDHVDTLIGLQALTYYYSMTGARDKSLLAAEKVMRRARESRGGQRPDTWLSQSELAYATALVNVDRVSEAIDILRAVIVDERKLLAANDEQSVDSEWVLAYALSAAGHFDRAIPGMQRYIERNEHLSSPKSAARAEYLLYLDIAYIGARRATEALATADQIAEIAATVGDIPEVHTVRRELVRLQSLVLNGATIEAEQQIARLQGQPSPFFPFLDKELLAISLQNARLQNQTEQAVQYANQLLEQLPSVEYRRTWRLHVQSNATMAFLGAGKADLARSTFAQARNEYEQLSPDLSVRLHDFFVAGAMLGAASQQELEALVAAWRRVNPGSVWHGEALFWLSKMQEAAGHGELAAKTREQARAMLKSSNHRALRLLAV